jgi:hypothetical protein
MNELTNGTVYVSHIRAEHHRLNQMIVQIERELPLVQDEMLPWETHARAFREALSVLRDELAAHFLEEEQGGCLEEASCRCPSLAREAARLLEEHAVLLGELDQVIAAVAAANTARRIHELGYGFERFAKTLRRHEEDENRLLESAFGASPE